MFQAERWGSELLTEDVEHVDLSVRPFAIRTSDTEVFLLAVLHIWFVFPQTVRSCCTKHADKTAKPAKLSNNLLPSMLILRVHSN